MYMQALMLRTWKEALATMKPSGSVTHYN
jgi:hypothetical protein